MFMTMRMFLDINVSNFSHKQSKNHPVFKGLIKPYKARITVLTVLFLLREFSDGQ